MRCEQGHDLSFVWIAEQFLMFSENLHSWQEFCTTFGRTGRAKYQLCAAVKAKVNAKYQLCAAVNAKVNAKYQLCAAVNAKANFSRLRNTHSQHQNEDSRYGEKKNT